ncbi:MAG: hypothetical protein DMF72_20475 [Acidobacteria bacterium]|nr:MAG: hypothetical protein DMF72_20475 [Acidobacteriota bacterium]
MRKDLFTITSRYYTVETTQLTTAEGKTIVYLKRRRMPQPEEFVPLQEHRVIEGDRLDNITAKYLGDPEQFWRLCDSNNAMEPEELTDEVGSSIRITLPEGIPVNTNSDA